MLEPKWRNESHVSFNHYKIITDASSSAKVTRGGGNNHIALLKMIVMAIPIDSFVHTPPRGIILFT